MLQRGKVLVCTNLDWFSVSASAGTILVHPVFLEQPSKNMSWFEAAKAPSFLSLDGEGIGAIEGLPMSSSEVDDSKSCIWEERRQEQKKWSGFSLNVSQKGVRARTFDIFQSRFFLGIQVGRGPWGARRARFASFSFGTNRGMQYIRREVDVLRARGVTHRVDYGGSMEIKLWE